MATLNELGRNSSSLTYGPFSNGQDLFLTLNTVDQWFRNDTWQGTATASGFTVSGVGTSTIFNTQARAGDVIMIAGQIRTVASVTNDQTLTVSTTVVLPTGSATAPATTTVTYGSGFSPAITTPSAIRVIYSPQATQTQGYISTIVRGATSGTIAVTNGNSVVTGTNTYFLSDATNSVATTAVGGTIAIDTSGNITGTGTAFLTGGGTYPAAGIANGLYPGDSIAVTSNGAIYYFTIATVTADNGSNCATVVTAPTTAIPSLATVAKATNATTGRYVNINGRIRQITAISSNNSMTVNFPMDFTDSNLRYKVYPRGTFSNATTTAATTIVGASSVTSNGTTTLTAATMTAGYLIPGMVLAGTNVPAGTTIVNQLYATGTQVASFSATATINQNTLTLTSTTNVAVGQIVQGLGAALTGVLPSTYVVAINTSTNVITLSQNLTAAWVNATVYFYVPGIAGVYTTSQALTAVTAITSSNMIANVSATNVFWDLGTNNVNNTAVSTPYMFQTSALDQVWFGDEVRTINFNSFNGTVGFTAAAGTAISYSAGANIYLTDYAGYSATAIGLPRQGLYGAPFKREDSYINGNTIAPNIGGTVTPNTTAFTKDLRVGDDIIIDGTECTVTQIVSDTQFKINMDFTHTTAANSGGAATGSTTIASGGAAGTNTATLTANTNIQIGQLVTGVGLPQGTYLTSITASSPYVVTFNNNFNVASSGTYNFYNGSLLYKKQKLHGYFLEGTREGGANGFLSATYSITGTASTTTTLVPTAPASGILPGQVLGAITTGGTVSYGTTIVNQLYATGPTATPVTSGALNVAGTNILSVTATTNVSVGYLVSGNAAINASIPASTYVLGVNSVNNTITLSQNLTGTLTTGTTLGVGVSGGVGGYTLSTPATLAAASTAVFTPSPGKFSTITTLAGGSSLAYPIGSTVLTLASATNAVQFNFVKVAGAGGPPLVLSGQVTAVQTYVFGTNTLFTTQLHIGAEIVIAGQYLTVVYIISDTQLLVRETITTAVTSLTPIYRSVPLYTYITLVAGSNITLATPIKNNLIVNAAGNAPQISLCTTGADFIEYVYSAPNYSAEQGTTTLLNTTLDRKYVGFRMFPLYQGSNAAPAANGTTTSATSITTALGAFATPVYERWAASYAQTNGVGVNMADLSGGTVFIGSQSTTSLTVTASVAGNLQAGMAVQGAINPSFVNSTQAGFAGGTPGSIFAVTNSQTIAASSVIVGSLNGVYDIQAMSQVSGGYMYLFANKRYLIIQGKTFSNLQTQWQGVVEFERAQPEDAGTGFGTSTGVTYTAFGGAQMAQGAVPTTVIPTPGFSQSIQYTPGISPWPCFAYCNGNRFPTGSGQVPTLPALGNYPVHGGVLSTPRVRNSSGDLVGFNAHIYSACTITTGRWGHTVEFGAVGSYAPSYLPTANTLAIGSNTVSLTANVLPQIHLGQIVPTYTNVYNSKRFMFSPVVVLGPAYDPDVRGRFFGVKIIPSNLGTLMDTVSITANNATFFYDTTQLAIDHWVIGSPPSAGTVPGQTVVVTQAFSTTQNAGLGPQQVWRSLEDPATRANNTPALFTNNFRMAVPA
jgi:hypothetical protein